MATEQKQTKGGEEIPSSSKNLPTLTAAEVEKSEEEKLRAKYKLSGGLPLRGHSVFLQKKLAKGQKFFDSGDYQMAKQKCSSALKSPNEDVNSPPLLNFGTGDTIPTPDTVPVRKTSIIQAKSLTPTNNSPS